MCLRAYPRSHGATRKSGQVELIGKGLSPLARGNQRRMGGVNWPVGPIPARTGQPRWLIDGKRASGAYPRSHGATDVLNGGNAIDVGLSPLARGNRAQEPPGPGG